MGAARRRSTRRLSAGQSAPARRAAGVLGSRARAARRGRRGAAARSSASVPTAWALVIEDRGEAFVVRHEDGRVGYLHDIGGRHAGLSDAPHDRSSGGRSAHFRRTAGHRSPGDGGSRRSPRRRAAASSPMSRGTESRALRAQAERFDGVDRSRHPRSRSRTSTRRWQQLDPAVRTALEEAIERVRTRFRGPGSAAVRDRARPGRTRRASGGSRCVASASTCPAARRCIRRASS